MSPLEKMIIQALENEDDDIILAEVLDFYEYLKEKKKRQKDTLWKNIQEDEPTNEEIEIINNYIQREAKDEPYRLSRNSKERELSYLREKSLRDEISALANAKEKGLKEGIKQGLFEGKLESARSFLDILDDDTIATKLNIDVDIIKKLRIEKLKK